MFSEENNRSGDAKHLSSESHFGRAIFNCSKEGRYSFLVLFCGARNFSVLPVRWWPLVQTEWRFIQWLSGLVPPILGSENWEWRYFTLTVDNLAEMGPTDADMSHDLCVGMWARISVDLALIGRHPRKPNMSLTWIWAEHHQANSPVVGPIQFCKKSILSLGVLLGIIRKLSYFAPKVTGFVLYMSEVAEWATQH